MVMMTQDMKRARAEESLAWKSGYQAYYVSEGFAQNPHEAGTLSATWWAHGFTFAEKEDQAAAY
jgi:hypothetical protein